MTSLPRPALLFQPVYSQGGPSPALVKSSLGQVQPWSSPALANSARREKPAAVVSSGHGAAQGRNGLTVPGGQRAKTESIRPILTALIQINEAFSAFYTMA